jgi:hypothetical protein
MLKQQHVEKCLVCKTCYDAQRKRGKAFKNTEYVHKYEEHLRTYDHDAQKKKNESADESSVVKRSMEFLPEVSTPAPKHHSTTTPNRPTSKVPSSGTVSLSSEKAAPPRHEWQDAFSQPLMAYAFPLAMVSTGTSIRGGERLLTMLNPYISSTPLPTSMRAPLPERGEVRKSVVEYVDRG